MGDIVAAGVAVTLLPQDYYNPPGMLNVSFPTIAFGNSSDSYPATGIPLPDMGLLGEFKKEIKRILITPPPGNGYIYKWDKVNKSIRIYEAPAAGTLVATANLHDATLTIAAPGANVHAAPLTMEAATGNVANLAVDANTALHSGVLTMQAATGNLANRVVDVAAPAGNVANKVVDVALTGAAVAGQLVEFSGNPALTSLDLMVIGE